LLQVLQDGSFSRVGGENVLCSDARVIAATNSDLQQMARDGLFRNDLFYRLNVFPIEIPPLRERIEDIPIFIDVFLKKLEKTYRKGITMVHERVVEALKHYSWPGNIRELENLIERAYIIETSAILLPKSFPIELFSANKPSAILPIDDSVPLADARKKAVEAFELQYLKKLLARHEGKIKKSANEAGISMRQLHKLLSKYGIHKEEYKK
jgi:DNA-binding NtrC family response regulator